LKTKFSLLRASGQLRLVRPVAALPKKAKSRAKNKHRHRGDSDANLDATPIQPATLPHLPSVALRPGSAEFRAGGQVLVHVHAAWQRLGDVRELGPWVLADLLLVLGMSVEADVRNVVALPPLRPRGDRSERSIDLRGWLGDRDHVRALLVGLAEDWSVAVATASDLVPELSKLEHVAPSDGFCPDPYLAVHHDYRGDIKTAGMSQSLVLGYFPLLRGATWEEASKAATWVDRVSHDPKLRFQVSRVCEQAPGDCAAAWVGFALSSGAEAETILRIVRKESLLTSMPGGACLQESLAVLRRRVPKARREALSYFCRWIAAGASPAYALGGALLWKRSNSKVSYLPAGEDAPFERIRLLAIRADNWWHALRVWQGCALLPGMAERVVQLPLSQMTNREVTDWLSFLDDLVPDDADDVAVKAEGWARIDRRWDEIVAAAKMMDGRDLNSFLYALGCTFRQFRGPKDTLEERWGLVLELATRAYLRKRGKVVLKADSDLVLLLAKLPTVVLRAVLESDSLGTLRAMTKFLNQMNRSDHFKSGFLSLFLTDQSEMAEALVAAPGQFCRVAFDLGTLQLPEVREILGLLKEHPVFDQGLEERSVGDLVALCDAARIGRSVVEPVSKRLRAHVDGQRTLEARHLAHDRSLVLTGLRVLRLALLAEEVSFRLCGVDGRGLATHTMQMARVADANRRALKRFLRAHQSGDSDYLLRQSGNRRWIETHSWFDWEVWIDDYSISLGAGKDEHVLAFENDPEEVLRMGDYVGSCLSLGGCNAHSAAANLLDVNKRVVFARDSKGKVVARMLLALSEERRLVPFEIYASKDPGRDLQLKFVNFLQQLAEDLGIALHRGGSDWVYTIARPHSQNWYDDGPWDFAIDPPKEPARVQQTDLLVEPVPAQ